jgi:adenylate cyclase
MKFAEVMRPARTAFVIGLAVFAVCGVLWRLGLFQEPELWIYDHFVDWHSDPKATDSRFALVLQDEKDIENLDYPLRDSVLLALLEKIESGGPCVVGLDLYRDLPEPRDGSESAILTKTLLKYPNIVPIFLYNTADPDHPFDIPPPPAVANDPSRFSQNNLLYDHKTVRRAELLLPFDKKYSPYPSFAFVLAEYYLAGQNVQLAQAGDNLILGKTTFYRFLGNEGGYVNAEHAGIQFLQDFRGPREADKYAQTSVREALKLGDASMFKDKIVLIGASEDSGNDVEDTPVGQRIPGVIIHAMIANQLLRAALNGEQPTRGVTEPYQWPWLALWGVAGVIAGFFVRSHPVFAISVGLAVGMIVAAAWLLFLHGYWITVFGPIVVFLATAMLVKAYAAAHERLEREKMKKLFSQRVPPAIVDEIWNQRETFLQGGRPVAQKLMVTVLFTDLKNYSTISEGMTPPELIAWVNECQGALTRHVEKNRGMVFCFMGDGMMAVFGAPIPRQTETEQAEDAVNAVKAAQGMSEEIRQMNARWKSEGKPLAGLRVGIFTGEAMAGDLGSNDYLEYSVIGDTVNTASRLESVDKEGELTGGEVECRILIGELTYKYVGSQFTARHVGAINLKGKAGKTEIYNVLDSSDQVEQTDTKGQ